MPSRRKFLAALWAFPMALYAQADKIAWPNRAVKIIVGFPPGQATDGAARVVSHDMQQAFGQPFIVDNRPSAGATLASRTVANSTPDGYTLLLSSGGPIAIAPHLYANLGYDALNDLEPIALVGRSPLILVVRSDFPANTIADLAKMSRSGKQIFGGSGGNGVTNHLALEMFKIASGANITHVPYKGAGPALIDLIGGSIQMMFETKTALTHVRSGKLKVLAVTSLTRDPELPDVPTVAETYKGFEAQTWGMMCAPKGTPAPIKERIAAQLSKSMKDPAARDKLSQMGIEPTPDTSPAKAKAYAVSEYEKWGRVIREAKVKID